jgi:hypothetical protein
MVAFRSAKGRIAGRINTADARQKTSARVDACRRFYRQPPPRNNRNRSERLRRASMNFDRMDRMDRMDRIT